MRAALAAHEGIRETFCGTVVRFGSKANFKGYPQPTLLIKEIKETATGKFLADHLWFTVGKRLAELYLQADDIIQFDARVTPYEKGYKGYRDDVDAPISIDYRLSFPTNIKKINKLQ
jgi:hypothetical protein